MAEKHNEEKEIKENVFIRWIKKIFRFSNKEHYGKYYLQENKQLHFSTLTLVVILLGITDFIFALDSIPTIISLVKSQVNQPFTSDEILVIYSSNIFAILGLRALFVILQNMSQQFKYLQKAIGIVLIFIGFKMLAEFFHFHISVSTSLITIISILSLGILLSKIKSKVS